MYYNSNSSNNTGSIVQRTVISVPSEHQDSIINDFVQIRENSEEWVDLHKILFNSIKDLNRNVEWLLKDVDFVVNPELDLHFNQVLRELRHLVS